MKFKEALKSAGLSNPGRTTWCGTASDGTPVFTIWAHDIRYIKGRRFAWWDHGERKDPAAKTPSYQGRQRTFVALAAASKEIDCRAVILYRKSKTSWDVGAAEYPHPEMSRLRFRAADGDSLQFIAELMPAGATVRDGS